VFLTIKTEKLSVAYLNVTKFAPHFMALKCSSSFSKKQEQSTGTSNVMSIS